MRSWPGLRVPHRDDCQSALACCLLGSLGAILVAYLAPVTLQDLIIAALPANFALMLLSLAD